MAVVFSKIFEIVKNTPSLLSITRPHFPRPRLLRTCLDMTFLHKDFLSRELHGHDPRYYKPLYWMWILVYHLEQLASIDRQCSRRGCRNRRVWRCRACKSVGYCGAECQSKCVPVSYVSISPNFCRRGCTLICTDLTSPFRPLCRDWPEHRLCCGFRGIRIPEPNEHEDDYPTLPLPQRLPFRLEAVLPLSSLAAFESLRPGVHE